jgi:hypothetical protein
VINFLKLKIFLEILCAVAGNRSLLKTKEQLKKGMILPFQLAFKSAKEIGLWHILDS